MPAWESPAIWRPEHSPSAVIVVSPPDAFAAARTVHVDDVPTLASVIAADGRHVLLGDPDGPHQLWLVDNSFVQGAGFVIPFDDDFPARLHGVQRLHRLLTGRRAGPLLCSLQLTQRQRMRLTLQVRALDGLADGASRREIAAVLLDAQARDIPAIEWTNTALRKRINRIIIRAKAMMNGGYLMLLRGDAERAKRFRRR